MRTATVVTIALAALLTIEVALIAWWNRHQDRARPPAEELLGLLRRRVREETRK